MRNAVLFGSTPVRSQPKSPIPMDTGRKPLVRRTEPHQGVFLSGRGKLCANSLSPAGSSSPVLHSPSLPAQSEQPPSESPAPPGELRKGCASNSSSCPNGQHSRSVPRILPGSESNRSKRDMELTLARQRQARSCPNRRRTFRKGSAHDSRSQIRIQKAR